MTPGVGVDLTVVIPAYNSERTIASAIASGMAAGAQVIVIDDGSTDSTRALSQKCGATVLSQENSGAARARERGLGEVTTAYVLFLDADDSVIPAGIGHLLAKLGSDTAAVGAIGAYVAVSVSGSTTKETLVRPWAEGVDLNSLLARGHAPAPPASIIWRASILRSRSLPCPPLGPRWAEDYEQLLRGAMSGRLLTSSTPVSKYQTGGGKSSTSPLASLTSSEDLRRYYAEHARVKIRRRSSRELASLSMRRRAFGAAGGIRMWWLARSVLASPNLYIWLARERVRRQKTVKQAQADMPVHEKR